MVMDGTISVKDFFYIIWKKKFWISLGAIIGVVISMGINFYTIIPTYTASTKMITTLPIMEEPSNQGTIQLNDLNTNIQLIKTYKDLIEEDSIILQATKDQLEQNFKYKRSLAELSEMIEVIQSDNSQIFKISVTSERASESAAIANTVAPIFMERAASLITRSQRVEIMSSATEPLAANDTKEMENIAIGGMLGAVILMVFLFFVNFSESGNRFLWGRVTFQSKAPTENKGSHLEG